MKGFFNEVSVHLQFVLVSLAIVAGVILLAFLAEKMIQKRNGVKEAIFSTRKIAMIGMFSAISGLLMYFEFEIPFLAPPFYKLDFSELPVLICGFAFGPVAGIVTEFLKIVIKLLFRSTSTAFVGDLANFVVGCTLILPATLIYHMKKKKLNAIVGCITGAVLMICFGTWFNYVYLIPTFSEIFGMPEQAIWAAGKAINSSIDGKLSFVLICVAPLNLLKSSVVSLITIILYKPLSPIIKFNHYERRNMKHKEISAK